MPTVLVIDGFRFFFFSNEGKEPVHVHIEKGEKYAKFWLIPVSLAYNYKFNNPDLNRIMRIIEKHRNQLEEKWNEYFDNH